MPDDRALPADRYGIPTTVEPRSWWSSTGAFRWFGIATSFALIVVILSSIGDLRWDTLANAISTSPLFWLLFAAYYLAGPLSEWVIYRRLWAIPIGGIPALLRKTVSNELLLGYLGEAQFYAWARSNGAITAAPFGAIKDVTVLSALTGNIATLIILAFAWPFVQANLLAPSADTIFLSLGVVLITSFLALLIRRRLFTLPARDLWFITGIHSVRIVAVIALAGLMWHVALPGIAVALWLVLAALRMLVSRLPLIPNKDIAFAGLAAFLVGQDQAITALLSIMAALILITHIIVGALMAAANLIWNDT